MAFQLVMLGLPLGSFSLGVLPCLVCLVVALVYLLDLRVDFAGRQISLARLGDFLGV